MIVNTMDSGVLERQRMAHARAQRMKIKALHDPDIRELVRQVNNLKEENRLLREQLNTSGDLAEAAEAEPKTSTPSGKRGRPSKA